VHVSARFSYVSPVATVPMKGGAALHIVDAGYFDNSGSLAVIELLKSWCPPSPIPPRTLAST
jgi:hypothetical protein